MTVGELFDCFLEHFNKIIYLDITNNIQDSIELRDCNNDVKTEEYDKFIDQYGSSKVDGWRFDNYNNDIVIDIKK